jgi:WD40 repeat protein
VLAGYEIVGELGRGGMGIVYKARQVSRDRYVAIKVIRKDRLMNAEAVRRFRREAQAAARLAHPNIVLVYDSDQAGDTHYLAMEYVQGITLERLVEQEGALPLAQAFDYLRQAAAGLKHAHEQALVHRDIKPANVMVAGLDLHATAPGHRPAASTTLPWGLIKILDMGVARLYHLSQSPVESLSTLTQDGSVIGTADYIAPEQLENPHGADIRADLYSLGCTLYYLLTARVPFPGGTLIQKLDRQRWETPPAVDQFRTDISPGFVGVIRKLMAKRPTDRFQTPAELASALERVAASGSGPSVMMAASRQPLRLLTGHADAVWSVGFSRDGRRIVSGGKDHTIRLWDAASGQEVRCLRGSPQEVRSVALSSDSSQVLAATGASVRIWEVASGQETGRFTGHTDAVRSVALLPGGARAASAGDDRTVRIWDVQTGKELQRIGKHTGGVTSIAVSPDGLQLLSASRDQALCLWDLRNGQELRRFALSPAHVLAVAFSPDGRLALSGHFDTILRLWEVETGRELRRFQGHKQMITASAFTADGRVLSGSQDHGVCLWDVDSGCLQCRFEGHTGGVTGVAVSPDSRHAVSGSLDKTLCLWELTEVV